jgi:hypothetical protein
MFYLPEMEDALNIALENRLCVLNTTAQQAVFGFFRSSN